VFQPTKIIGRPGQSAFNSAILLRVADVNWSKQFDNVILLLAEPAERVFLRRASQRTREGGDRINTNQCRPSPRCLGRIDVLSNELSEKIV